MRRTEFWAKVNRSCVTWIVISSLICISWLITVQWQSSISAAGLWPVRTGHHSVPAGQSAEVAPRPTTRDAVVAPHLTEALGCHPRDPHYCHCITNQKLTQPFYCSSGICPGIPGWAGTRNGQTNLDLLEQEIVSGSGICWAICKSAPHPR